jgi:serine/threonine protein kinase
MAKVYGRWRIMDTLSEGGQAHLFLVEDEQDEFDGIYVLKRYKNPKRELRFRNEINALIDLEHETINKLIDYSLEDEKFWYVQKYLKAGDLEKFVITHEFVDISLIFDFFVQICEGLKYCHSKGIFHRDIKPSNILINDDKKSIVISDFGLCWLPMSETRATSSVEAVGSWHYMAPEYSNGRVEEPTAKGDIYSLGKVLYFLLSNGLSFDREIHREGKWNIVNLHKDKIPENLYLEHANNLMDKMIAYEPNYRFSIVDVLGEARDVKRLILGKFNPIQGNLQALCYYCGIGLYQPVAKSGEEYRKYFGLQTTAVSPSAHRFRALVCDHCGNVQLFNIDTAKIDWFPKP